MCQILRIFLLGVQRGASQRRCDMRDVRTGFPALPGPGGAEQVIAPFAHERDHLGVDMGLRCHCSRGVTVRPTLDFRGTQVFRKSGSQRACLLSG